MSIFKKSNMENKMVKTSDKLSGGLLNIFSDKKINDAILEDLEDLLLSNDIGVVVTEKILSEIKKNKYNKVSSVDDVKQILFKYLKEFLNHSEKTLVIDIKKKPYVIMFVGINGVGKTTVIGKIAKKLKNDGFKVLVGACDTFRAGATEQLTGVCKLTDIDVECSTKERTEPATIAYKSLERAKKENFDVLLLDTAGRMQNNTNLMQELQKIDRILKKLDSNGISETILVLDATVGQNAKKQVEMFSKCLNISGLIMNKMDGTSKGGILVSLIHEFKKPVYAIGVGEGTDDLQEFSADSYIKELLNIK